jgi:hypothetical protein
LINIVAIITKYIMNTLGLIMKNFQTGFLIKCQNSDRSEEKGLCCIDID